MAVVLMPVLVNSFQGYSQGVTPAANLGGAPGAAGNLGTAAGFGWDAVTVTAGSTMIYDSTVAHDGGFSCKIATTGAVTCYTMWDSAGMLQAAVTQPYYRIYLYMTGNPATQHQVCAGTVSGTASADVIITTSGKVAMRALATGTPVITTTNSVPLNQWFRLEGFVLSDAAVGQVQVNLYDTADSATPTETLTSAANLDTTGGVINQWRWGLATAGVSGVNWWMAGVALSTTGPVGPGAQVQQMTCGAPTPGGFTVISKPVGGTSCRLKVGTNQALTTGVQFIAAQVPDQYGYVTHTVTGLAPATQYYCAIADTPNGGTEALCGPQTGACRTTPAAGAPRSFRVAFASCTDNAADQPSPNAALNDWIAWNADLNIHLGDFNYYDPTYTDIVDQIAILEAQNCFYGSAAQVATAWGYGIRSDHDSTTDGGDTGPVGACPFTPFNIAAHQEVFPYGTLGDNINVPVQGLYQTFTVGRVRFILLDMRTQNRSPVANTDNASKTMLGAQQLAWFYQQLVQPEPLKVIVTDTGWMGGGSDTSCGPGWWLYSTERAAIISFITANKGAVQNVMLWHGDDHCVATCPPVSNAYGGFPVYCAAPLRQTGAAIPNVAATFPQYYNNAAGACRQYGRVTFTDNGSIITCNYVGWDALNQVAQITQTDTFPAPSTAARPYAHPALGAW
jgi:PhoD-like phosphatase